MFEHLNRPAREAVVAARDEARQMRHRFVGTEHLLLGLLTERQVVSPSAPVEAGAALRVLLQLGLDAGQVKAEITRAVGTGPEALGEQATNALSTIGIDLDLVRSTLEESFGEGVLDLPGVSPLAGRLAFTRRSKKSLMLSLREARHLGDSFIGPEHLLLGLIREGTGLAAQILSQKAPLHELRRSVLVELYRAA